MENFILVKVHSKYCDYLRKFDNRVPYNKDKKELRPFIGIIFAINNCEYFVPLSSPKKKHLKMHNYVDFIKIDNGVLGALNINNMIPLNKNNYKKFDLYKKDISNEEEKYYILLKKQLKWLNKNKLAIKNKSLYLYNSYINNTLDIKIKERCCNDLLLEEKCKNYNKEVVKN